MEAKLHQLSVCKILVVDDDSAMRSLLVDELSDSGCQVIESTDGDDALSQVRIWMPSLIITDLKMPGGGFDYLNALYASVQHCPIILLTSFADAQTKKRALACGVAAYFDKPVHVNDLRTSLQHLCPFEKSQLCLNKVKRRHG